MPPPARYERANTVSVWVGDLAGPDESDAYFTEEYDGLDVPEAPVHWAPSKFQAELDLGFYPPWRLETNFPGKPKPVAGLVSEITFAETFGPLAVAAADARGIRTAYGAACVFHLDYRLKPGWAERVGPVTFLGAFAFVYREPKVVPAYQAVADRLGVYDGSVQVVAGLLADCTRGRPPGGKEFSAREFAAHIRGVNPEVHDLMRAHGLETSEAVGRIVMGIVDAGLARKSAADRLSDFDGLFDLRRDRW